MKALLATRNKHKTKEIRAILASFGLDVELLTLDDIGFFDEIIEDGKTFEENAKIKCDALKSHYDGIIIADDSGLCVDALDGEPGIYSARYADGKGDDANIKKLLEKLEGHDDRTARFVCSIAVVIDGKDYVVTGECKGRIAKEKRGSGDFGYDPVFEYDHRTFAQMSDEEKNAVSHRKNALRALASLLAETKNN